MSTNVLVSTMISGAISKLVELPNAYIINGHCYDKVNIAPVAQSFFTLPSSSACESILKEMSTIGNGFVGLKTKQSYIQDMNDPNIVYLVPNINMNGNAAGINFFYKLKKDSYKYFVIGKSQMMAIASKGDYDIIGDDTNFVYVSARHNNEYFSIFRINKDSLVCTELNIQAAGSYNRTIYTVYPQVVNGHIYMSVADYSSSKFGIVDVDLSTWTKTAYLGTAATIVGFQYSDISIDNAGILHAYFMPKVNELWRMDFNPVTKVLTDTKVNTLSNLPITTGSDTNLSYLHFMVNKDYIIMAARHERTVPTGVAERDILLWKIETDNSVTFKGYLDTEFAYTNFLFSEVDDLLFVANSVRVDVIAITVDRNLNRVQSLTPSYLHTLGRDSNGNIFFINNDTSAHVMNREIPIKLTTTLGNIPADGFAGTPIPTDITFKMENHLGEVKNGKVRVDLLGPAVFTDGSQSKDIDIVGVTKIPILIVNFGDITINAVNI